MAARRGPPTPEGYVAAMAAARGLTVASRDTAPFEAAGVKVIETWGNDRLGATEGQADWRASSPEAYTHAYSQTAEPVGHHQA